MSDPELADFYRCHPRTISRMRQTGVDVSDPQAVAVALAESKNPSPVMVDRTIEILENDTPLPNESQ